jgi:hypothetical protein
LPAVLGGGLLLLSCGAAALGAADPADQAAYQDLRHTIQARTLLLQDRDLGPLNLGVRVKDRVVHLWGPVPSLDLMFRAVQLLQRVPDFLEVRNQLHVETPDDTPAQLLPAFVPPASSPPTAVPGFSREDEDWRGAFNRRRADGPALVVPAEHVRLRPAQGVDGPDTMILPAIAVPGAPAVQGAPGPLADAVRRLRQSDARYQGVQAEVRGGQVFLHGSVGDWQDVYDLATAIRRLAAVERVVLDDIHTLPGR